MRPPVLPDPLESEASRAIDRAEELVAQLAEEEIDRLLNTAKAQPDERESLSCPTDQNDEEVHVQQFGLVLDEIAEASGSNGAQSRLLSWLAAPLARCSRATQAAISALALLAMVGSVSLVIYVLFFHR